ncbi:hypothetical protein F2Q69_00047598 [Brassica cretica]|uniref:Uncharacterized protein n=1 Tax=Brassica cretica TaxID=69181 RepID=A0A8S9PW06_BRACR|nr:hypothetical protein F2Q69_00047598 [Brassica cretica]
MICWDLDVNFVATVFDPNIPLWYRRKWVYGGLAEGIPVKHSSYVLQKFKINVRLRLLLIVSGDIHVSAALELHRRVICLAMDGDLSTVRLRLVLLKSGQSALREEAVEEMKDLSTDETALVSVDSDARIWVELAI